MKTITPYNYPRNGHIILPSKQMRKSLDKVFPNGSDSVYLAYDYIRIELRDNCIIDSGSDSLEAYIGWLPDNIYNYSDSIPILTKRK